MTEIVSGHRAKDPEIVEEAQHVFKYIRWGGWWLVVFILAAALYIQFLS
jgi:hypothetical protein